MSTNIRVTHPLLTSLLLAAACSTDYEQTPLPPTASNADNESSGSEDTADPTTASSTATTQSGDSTVSSTGDSASTGGPDDTGGSSEGGTEADSTGSDSGESSTGEPVPVCERSTHRCVAAAPDGWNGPVAVTTTAAADDEACEGDYAEPATFGFSGLDAPPATCACACGSVVGDTCETETDIAYFPPNYIAAGTNTTGCQLAAALLSVSGLEEANGVVPSRWLAQEVDAVGGSCSPSATNEVPDAGFSDRMHACAPTEAPAACEDDGLCMPITEQPFEAPLCVWKSGMNACPDEYPDQEVVHGGYDDDRSCSACECGAATGMICDDSVFYLWTGFTSHELPANGLCQYIGSGDEVTAINFGPGNPSGGSCAASGGEPEGGASPTMPTTICCES